jgi:hypothetical protein
MGRALVLVDVAHLLRGTLVCLSRVASGILVHTTSATTVTTLDVMVQGVGPIVSHRLPQLDGVHSSHARD